MQDKIPSELSAYPYRTIVPLKTHREIGILVEQCRSWFDVFDWDWWPMGNKKAVFGFRSEEALMEFKLRASIENDIV